ncbi:MAG: hypothetical protein ACTS5G_00045, partial [Burkholderiales bacterium]
MLLVFISPRSHFGEMKSVAATSRRGQECRTLFMRCLAPPDLFVVFFADCVCQAAAWAGYGGWRSELTAGFFGLVAQHRQFSDNFLVLYIIGGRVGRWMQLAFRFGNDAQHPLRNAESGIGKFERPRVLRILIQPCAQIAEIHICHQITHVVSGCGRLNGWH